MSVLTLQGGPQCISGSLDPRLGLVAIRVKCHAANVADALFGTLPDIGIAGLVENQARTFDARAGGTAEGYDVLVTLEGHSTPDNAEGEDYSLDGATSEDPIETHPFFLGLKEKFNGTIDPSSGKVKFDDTLAEGGEAGLSGATGNGLDATGGDIGARNPMHGVESYLVPGLTWTRKSVSRQLPLSIVRALGTIDSPPGQPPTLEGTRRNWLKARVRAQWRGNIWQIEESWLLSGPDGWLPDIYSAAAFEIVSGDGVVHTIIA
ncbi:MAG: hypothetical protein ABMA13_22230 [Chthoniobacteraceae bacterium]